MRAGQIDAFATFITNATLNGLPYIDLPEEIDQSNPSMAKWYATASYTNPNGQTFRVTSAAYAVTIPVAVGNRQGRKRLCSFFFPKQDSGRGSAQAFTDSRICASRATRQWCRNRYVPLSRNGARPDRQSGTEYQVWARLGQT